MTEKFPLDYYKVMFRNTFVLTRLTNTYEKLRCVQKVTLRLHGTPCEGVETGLVEFIGTQHNSPYTFSRITLHTSSLDLVSKRFFADSKLRVSRCIIKEVLKLGYRWTMLYLYGAYSLTEESLVAVGLDITEKKLVEQLCSDLIEVEA